MIIENVFVFIIILIQSCVIVLKDILIRLSDENYAYLHIKVSIPDNLIKKKTVDHSKRRLLHLLFDSAYMTVPTQVVIQYNSKTDSFYLFM